MKRKCLPNWHLFLFLFKNHKMVGGEEKSQKGQSCGECALVAHRVGYMLMRMVHSTQTQKMTRLVDRLPLAALFSCGGSLISSWFVPLLRSFRFISGPCCLSFENCYYLSCVHSPPSPFCCTVIFWRPTFLAASSHLFLVGLFQTK